MTLTKTESSSRQEKLNNFLFPLMLLLPLIDYPSMTDAYFGLLLSGLGGWLLGMARWIYLVKPHNTAKPPRMMVMLAGLVGVMGVMCFLFGIYKVVELSTFPFLWR